jgi:hypothetical protein
MGGNIGDWQEGVDEMERAFVEERSKATGNILVVRTRILLGAGGTDS